MMPQNSPMPRYLMCILCACFILSSRLIAAEWTEELQKKASTVFRGFDDTIMRINSGICRITGKTIETNGNVIDDNILIAFDYDAHFYRFDNGNLKRALLTPEFYHEIWHPNTHAVSVKRSSASSPEVTSIYCRLIDIQNLFRFIPVGIEKPYDYQQSEFHQQNENIRIIDYEELPNGLVKITTEIPQPPTVPKLHSEYVINQKEGYTVQQINISAGYIHKISWENINQTWVPVAYVFKSGPQFGDFGVTWKIDWEQVNEKVDTKYFSLKEMLADREDGALMFSDELGTGTLIEEDVLPENSYFPFRYILMGLGIFFIILGLGKKAYDQWKK